MLTQNTSHAVMAQRVEARDSLDFFPTPPWATRALCEHLARYGGLKHFSCWEPACGEGDMAHPLAEYFDSVYCSDIAVGFCGDQHDFLFPGDTRSYDWIITNPPFRLAEQFARQALTQATCGVAMFVRTAFLEGVGRYERLFAQNRPTLILQFTERVPIHKGKLTETGTTATAYCWVIWRVPSLNPTTEFNWIAPCRRKLERPGDYPAEVAA